MMRKQYLLDCVFKPMWLDLVRQHQMGYLIENVLQKNSSLKILKKRDVDEKLLSKEKINIKKRKKKNKIHMIKWKHIKKIYG